MIKKFLIGVSFFLVTFFAMPVYAGSVDFSQASPATTIIRQNAIAGKSWTMEEQLNKTSFNILKTLKVAIGALLVIYLVYSWVMMIMAMGEKEDDIKSAKNNIWYAAVGLLFINIPGTLYEALTGKRTGDDITSALGDQKTIYERNIFMNSQAFGDALGMIVSFLQVAVVVFAVFIFILQWIKLINSKWDEDVAKEAKSKILYSLMGLVFLGIMEVWRSVVFTSNMTKGKELFQNLANLALFFAGPVAIFFLALAWYYYITSAGDDDKIKKAKSIVFNTVIATLLLLGMYTFLLDLKNFIL